jgi:glycosyltransferase involved in cell wall biosynthesis
MNKHPLVSLIVPMYNEEKYIDSCLQSLLNQDYPKNQFEILVIDGNSSDKSFEIVSSLSAKNPIIRLFKNPGRTTSKALNIGIKHSRGDIIIRMDAHSISPVNYVSSCVKYLLSKKADNVGVLMKSVGEDFWDESIALGTSSQFGVGNSKHRCTDEEGSDDFGWLGSFWKDTLIEMGGYDESLECNEDDDLNYRLLKNGKKIFRSSVQVYYFSRSSLFGLWRQYFRYGFWKVKVIQKFGSVTSLRHIIPFLFVISLIIFSILSIFVYPSIYPLFFILGMYFLISIVYSIQVSRKSGWKYFFSLPLIFLILHLSYGIGFLLGTIRFLCLNSK